VIGNFDKLCVKKKKNEIHDSLILKVSKLY